MNVLGIDLSMTSTGLALVGGPDCRRVHTDAVESKPPKRARGDKTPVSLTERRRRIRTIRDDVLCWAPLDRVMLAVIEGPSYSSAGAGTWDRAWLWGQVVECLMRNDIPVAVCPPGARAKWATGSGAASKSPVAVHMSRMWPDLGLSISDDEWDAVALASAGAQRLGWLPIELERHREQLAKMEWPDLPDTSDRTLWEVS